MQKIDSVNFFLISSIFSLSISVLCNCLHSHPMFAGHRYILRVSFPDFFFTIIFNTTLYEECLLDFSYFIFIYLPK